MLHHLRLLICQWVILTDGCVFDVISDICIKLRPIFSKVFDNFWDWNKRKKEVNIRYCCCVQINLPYLLFIQPNVNANINWTTDSRKKKVFRLIVRSRRKSEWIFHFFFLSAQKIMKKSERDFKFDLWYILNSFFFFRLPYNKWLRSLQINLRVKITLMNNTLCYLCSRKWSMVNAIHHKDKSVSLLSVLGITLWKSRNGEHFRFCFEILKRKILTTVSQLLLIYLIKIYID